MRAFPFSVALLMAVGVAVPLRAESIESHFDTNAQGWGVSGDATAFTWVSTGGNPGGFVRATDIVASNTWFFVAGSQYYGDRSHYYGGTLSFDLKQFNAIDAQYDDRDIILTGGGKTLIFNTATNPGSDWTSYLVNLVEPGWTTGSLAGPATTSADFQTVLANLTSIQIRGEYRSGADSAGLDNVVLFTTQSSAVPLPAAALGGVTLLGGLGLSRSRGRSS